MSSPSKLWLMRMEQGNLRKDHPQGNVQRCQKQKMPLAGGVAGIAPSSAMTSKRRVTPMIARMNVARRGTIASAMRCVKEKRCSATALTIAEPAEHLRQSGALAVHEDADAVDSRGEPQNDVDGDHQEG